jgi:hypothetical protein
MSPEEVVARNELRSAQRISARSQLRFGAATVQPTLPSPDYAGHGPQALVSALQRREAELITGASCLPPAGNLPRHRPRPGEVTPKRLGLPGQADRQLLAWHSVLARTGRLPAAHRLRDHPSHCTLRHWERQEVEHFPDFDAILGLWITRFLPVGAGQRIATVAPPRDGRRGPPAFHWSANHICL